MGDLGDVLELLHGAEPRWKTLRAVGRQWRHNPRQHEVLERRHGATLAGAPGVSFRWTGYVPDDPSLPPTPDETQDDWRLWMEGQSRVRLERSSSSGPVTLVIDRPWWWSWSPYLGARTNGGATNHTLGAGPPVAMVDTSALLTAMQLQVLESDVLLGRRVFRVRGVARPAPEHGPNGFHELGVDADDYVMSVDAERGILLRCEARLRELPFLVNEMIEIDFDVDLPDGIFTIDLPEGEGFEDVSRRSRRGWRRSSKLFPRVGMHKGTIVRPG